MIYRRLQAIIENAQGLTDDIVDKYSQYLSYGRLPGKPIMTDDDLPPGDSES